MTSTRSSGRIAAEATVAGATSAGAIAPTAATNLATANQLAIQLSIQQADLAAQQAQFTAAQLAAAQSLPAPRLQVIKREEIGTLSDRDSYPEWKIKVADYMVLGGHHPIVWSRISQNLSPLLPSDPDYTQWYMADQLLMITLKTTMTQDVRLGIEDSRSTKELLERIDTALRQQGNGHFSELCGQLDLVSLACCNDSVVEYVAALRTIRMKLLTLKASVVFPEEYIVQKFLNGLNST